MRLEVTSAGHLVQPPCLKEDHLEPFPKAHVWFLVFPRWRLHTLYEQTVSVLSHLHGKNGFPDTQAEPAVLQFVSTASHGIQVDFCVQKCCSFRCLHFYISICDTPEHMGGEGKEC